MACYALIQGIFPTQGSNLCLLWLLHCRQILNCWVTGEAPSLRTLDIKKGMGLVKWHFQGLSKVLTGTNRPSQRAPGTILFANLTVEQNEEVSLVTLGKENPQIGSAWHFLHAQGTPKEITSHYSEPTLFLFLPKSNLTSLGPWKTCENHFSPSSHQPHLQSISWHFLLLATLPSKRPALSRK